ncbi:unnamed protein product, partial [Mycena citricolor]
RPLTSRRGLQLRRSKTNSRHRYWVAGAVDNGPRSEKSSMRAHVVPTASGFREESSRGPPAPVIHEFVREE